MPTSLMPEHLVVAQQVLLVASNPGVEVAGFEIQVEMLQAMRPELDVAWTVRSGGAPNLEETLSPRTVMPHEQPHQQLQRVAS